MSRLRTRQLSSLRFVVSILSGAACLSVPAISQSVVKRVAPLPQAATPKVSGRAIPLVFEENAGQLPKGTAFAGRTHDYTVQIKPSELQFGLPGKKATRTVTLSFAGSKGAKPEGVTDAGFRTNFYIGNDRSKWHTGVQNFDRVALRQLYPGVDAEFYSHGNEIEHDFMLAPKADAGQLAMHLAGAKSVTLSQNGDLVLAAEEGALRLHKPNAYQVQADGSRKSVDANFELAKNGDSADLHFKLGTYDHDRALVIDPVITYATYVTGDLGSTPTSIQSDTSGNVYLTGYTLSSSANFSVTDSSKINLNPSSGLSDPPSFGVSFVARVSASDSGSKIAWLTYYGSASRAVNATASALSSNGTTLVIGGNTTALDLPGSTASPSTFQTQPTAGTGFGFGFLASFTTNNGVMSSPTSMAYLSGGASGVSTDNTKVGGIALDASGNITVAGTTNSATFPATANAITFMGQSLVIANAAESKGFIATFDPTFVTENYGTYISGASAISDTTLTQPATSLTGVAVDASGNIYFTGRTYNDFLQAGIYNDSTVAPANTPYPNAGGGFQDVFAAELTIAANPAASPAPPTASFLAYSFFGSGSGDDNVNGLSLDSSGNLLLYGQTTSSNFLANDFISTYNVGTLTATPSAGPEAAPATQFNPNYPALATNVGWTILLNNAGATTSSSFFAGDSSANSTNITGAVSGVIPGSSPSTVVYVTGTTTVTRAHFPVNGLGADPTGIPGLPLGQDNPSDSGDTNPQRSFLLQADASISTLQSLANLGSKNGIPASVGLVLDAPSTGSPNAYVAISDFPSSAQSYTTASAAEKSPQVTDGTTASAYVARVAYLAGGTPGSLTATAISGGNISPTVYGFTPPGGPVTGSTVLTVTFEVQTTAAVNNFVLDVPQSQYISNYSSYSISLNSAPVANACTLGTAVASTHPSPAPAVNGPGGLTCMIPSVPAGAKVDLVLSNETLTAAATAGTTVSLVATAYDDTGTLIDASVPLTPTGVPTFNFSNTVSTTAGPASTSGVTVNAALSTTDTTTPNTQVSYVYTIQNTSTFDSPQTVLTTNLDNSKISGGSPTITAVYSGPTTPYPTCTDPTTGTGCDIPAGDTLTYTVAGVYVGSQFSASSTSAFTVSSAAPTLTYVPVQNGGSSPPSTPTGNALTVTVIGNAQIAQTIGTSSFSYNQDGYELGQSGLQFTVTVKNTGPNGIGSYSGTFTLPNGFVVSNSSISATSGSPTQSCPAATPVVCTFTFSEINGGSTANTLTVTGSFQDTGTTSDAVGPPSTVTSPSLLTASTVAASPTVGSVSVASSAGAAGTTPYYPAVAAASSTFNVYRVNQLSSSVASTTPAALGANTVNAYSRLTHPALPTVSPFNDTVTYTVTINNTGTSGIRGLYATIPIIPSTVPVAAVQMIGTPSTSDASLACLPYASPATSLTCYQTDLISPPTPPSSTPPATYTVTYTLAYDQSLILSLNPGQKNAPLAPANADAFVAASDIASFTPPGGTPGTPTTYKAVATSGTVAVPTITLQRQASVANTLTYVPYNATAPATLADTTRLNLDEHTAGNIHGKNDTIIVTSSTTNGGPNDADGVSINIPLPAYMNVAVPAGCSVGAVTGPTVVGTLVNTGATGATMTCIPSAYAGTTALGNPQTDGTTGILNASSSATCAASATATDGTFSGSGYDGAHTCFQVAFYAKFADTANESTTIIGANPTGSVTYSAGATTDNDVPPATPVAPTVSSVALINSIQRAAHVRLSGAVFPAALPVPVYTDGSALTVDTTMTPNLPEVGQAANLYNISTRVATGSKVYNCFRYRVAVINDGPNYTSGSAMHYALSGGTYVPAGNSTNPSNTSPVNCTVSNTSPANTAPVGTLQPGGGTTVSLDGYFDLGSLNNVNSSQATFSTLPFSTTDAQDSNAAADISSNPGADFRGSQSLTIVNTPFNNASTAGIGITPVSTSAKANLIFTNVSQAGITNAISTTSLTCTTTGNVNNCYPYGKSPYPPDSGAARNLYEPGKTPTYYQVLTTAVAPQAAPSATTNPTSICLVSNSGGAFPDVFVKPERVLLWVLKNPAAGTTYNSFPTGFPAFTSTSSLAGDVTNSVTPNGVASYLTRPATPKFPQVPQAQPGTICGTVNGMTTTSTVDSTSASTAETFGLLEPVNFPPYVVGGVVASSASTGKGSTSGVEDVYLAVPGTTTAGGFTYDYNDRDPCYISSASTKRQTCDDNPYLATRMFVSGGGTAMTMLSDLGPETSTSLPGGTVGKQLSVIYATSGTGLFIAVADQATGADAFNSDIATTTGYSSNPFGHQGNFLLAPFSVSGSTGGASVCDPGTASFNGYTLSSTACAGGVSATSSQRYVSGGQLTLGTAITYGAAPGTGGNDYYLGTVGAQGISATISGTGSGLIPLPFPDGSTPPTSTSPLPRNPGDTGSTPLGPAANPTAAIANISAGQSAGFIWPWLASQTTALGVTAGGAPGDLYDLSCSAYDIATQQQPASLPAGMSCSITTTTSSNPSAAPTLYTFGASSPPTIYISTNGNLFAQAEPLWKRGLEGLALAMVLPVFFLRRRLGKGATLMLLFLSLAAAPLLSGCGSGGPASGSSSSGVVTPSGSYYLRVTAKPRNSGKANIVSAVFEVVVQSGS